MTVAHASHPLHGLTWALSCHIKFARGRHGYQYACAEFPELQVSKTSERGVYVEKRLFVADQEIAWGDLDEAWRLLMDRRGRPDDADEPCREDEE